MRLARAALTAVLATGAIGLAPSCAAGAAHCVGPACGGTLVLIGTHTGGAGQGIFAARLDRTTGALTSLGLAAEVERPTWLVADPGSKLVYSVSETGNDGKSHGSVYGLAVDRGTGRLSVRSHSGSGGGGATHLAYDPRLHTVFVANFGTGQVAAIPVDAEGRLGGVASVQQNVGTGPSKRQTGPHAHAVVVDPTGRFVLSPDLGADKVFVYEWDAATRTLVPSRVPPLAFPPGSGPRHLVFARDGRFAFLDTELNGEIHTLRWDAAAGGLTPVGHVALDPPEFTGSRSASELAVSADGRFLYVSNRGANVMQVFAIDRATGALAEIQRIDCGGQVPWSFALDPSGRWLIVTNEASGNLAVFAVDRRTGRIRATGQSLAVPKPVVLAFIR